ncbi:protease complex subunit PrcB family protein [Gilvimarinus agarilyticus]|uniref:protease complex subunit PrcB family protein n=1 Tax=unclassified Gilvimarinus TaxID=2642066 RepID=UPI001C08DA9A|nr:MULTISPECIES: protease complex subunit PrcB family protein [unclassified Gilvimarinus]MBU2887528.1 protease complex subunit PrcB family protein [Gilvimarinus agarilyticus]MDO6572179.1 protease complex subunit PrcB family protein [Gilvimarinus sp. 2_MG-2023]MDO6746743.1 protease complex subunit PrcB family protein [Gilvimarinus sp. 1_MG-2023]
MDYRKHVHRHLLRTSRLTLALLAAGMLSACGSDSGAGDMSIPFTAIDCPAVSGYTSYEDPYFAVIDNEHEYRERYLATDLNSQEEAPAVDFSTQQVIVLHAGMKPSGGHFIDVLNIIEKDGALQVNYQEGEPQTCSANTAIRYPYCFISIEATDKSVTFAGDVVNSCG